jgi:hypothetical protein
MQSADGAEVGSLETGLLFLGGLGLLEDSGNGGASLDLEILGSSFRAKPAADAVLVDHFETI